MRIHHVGILGAGNISDTHARAAASLPNVRVAAVCGANEARVRALAERHGATPTSTSTPSSAIALSTSSPSAARRACTATQVAAAAAQGLHVLVEKPLEVTTARIDEMARLVEQAGVTLGVFFQDRSTPDFVA